MAQFAGKLGIDPSKAAGRVARLSPRVVDHLTPNGAILDSFKR